MACEPCPKGTWSNTPGLVDQSLCEPCPEGRVCNIDGMTSVNDSYPCPAGYSCGEGTQGRTQFDFKSPAGFFTFSVWVCRIYFCLSADACGRNGAWQSFPVPVPGWVRCLVLSIRLQCLILFVRCRFFCENGTKALNAQRNLCPAGYYCPEGTAEAEPQQTRCPPGTSVLFVYLLLYALFDLWR